MTDERLRLRTADTLSSGGEAVAHAPDGRVVFIDGAAPSETVVVEITQDSKKFLRAAVVEVLERSADRVEPECDYFGVCGGCLTQHVCAEAQTRSKVKAVEDALRRIGGIDPSGVQIDRPWSGAPYAYRARARFAVAPGGVVGFRRRQSRSVVDVPLCPVLTPALQRGLERLRVIGQSVTVMDDVDAVAAGEDVMLRLPNRLAKLEDDPDGDPRVQVVRGRNRRNLTIEDEHGALAIAPGIFAQSNPVGNAALATYVVELIENETPYERILELYAGSGNLTRVLVPHGRSLIAVEGDRASVRLARRTLGPDVIVEEAPVEQALLDAEQAGEAPTLAVANPPRTGLSKAAARALKRMQPKTMVYVSCNPATFARDLSVLGLNLRRLRVFDLYPQTEHVELAALLTSSSV